jgi:quercetin dioxygenase-like cupin family protein
MNRAVVLILAVLGYAPVGSAVRADGRDAFLVVRSADIRWATCPADSGSCAPSFVLQGDPGKTGPFTLRLKTPAGWRVAPHFHRQGECVTVLAGGPFFIGSGDVVDDHQPTQQLGPGDFYCIPAGVHHFAWAEAETILQVQGVGPSERTFVPQPGKLRTR